MTAPVQLFRFAEYEFSTRQQELRKGGLRVRLSASQIRLLVLFLERPNELIRREEIASRIWSNTATIDVASGVNTAINRLRFSLGDNSVSPRYLETVIGLGYRFIAPVDPVPEADAAFSMREAAPETDTEPLAASPLLPELAAPSPEHNRALPRWAPWSAVAMLCVASAAALLFFMRERSVPVENSQTKLIAVSRVTANSGEKQITAAALSSDGKLLAYADSSGVRVQNLTTHQESALGTLPASEVSQLSWFPNSERLAVSGRDINTNLSTVWLLSSTGVGTSVLASDASLATVSPDGNKIAFTRAGGAEIWIMDHDGLGLRRLLQAEGMNVFSLLLWSPDNKRLMLVSHSSLPQDTAVAAGATRPPLVAANADGAAPQPDHWVWQSVDAATGKLLAQEENTPMFSAVISQRGDVRFVTGAAQGNALTRGKVYSVQTDPSTGRFLGAPVQENSFASHIVVALASSQDGSRVAFVAATKAANVFIATLRTDARGSTSLSDEQRLTSNLADTYPHGWAPDGTVIYEAPYLKHLAIFGRRREEAPVLLARLPVDAAMAQLAPGAQWILFLGIEAGTATIYRVRTDGGVPERVPGAAGLETEISCARTGPIACVLRRKESEHGVAERHYFAFDPVTGVGKLLARTPWVPSRRGDWSVSPDGSTIAVANRDPVHPALSLLELNGRSTHEKVITLSGHNAPLGVGWTPDGKALFIETRAAKTFSLLFMKIGGQPQVLRESPSLVWAVSSPDGKQIAFPESTTSTNVWVSERQSKQR